MNHSFKYSWILTRIAVAAVVVIVLCISLGAKANRGNPIQFEYKILNQLSFGQKIMSQVQQQSQAQNSSLQMHTYMTTHSKVLEETLNELGKEGWELSIMSESGYIFKRRSQ